MITISKDYIHETEWVRTENEKDEGVYHHVLVSKDLKTGQIKQKQCFAIEEKGGVESHLKESILRLFIDIVMSSKETITFTKDYLTNLHQELLKGDFSDFAVSSLNRMYLFLQVKYPRIYKWVKKEEEKMNQLENMIVFSKIHNIDEACHVFFDLPYAPNITIYASFDIKTKEYLGRGLWFNIKEFKEDFFYTVLIRKILLKESTQKRLQNYMKNHQSVRLQLMMI